MRGRIIFIAMALATAVFAQCGSQAQCGSACYDPTQYSCPTDYNGKVQLCPKGMAVCNGGCYNPANYHCQNGALAQGAASTVSAAKSTTKASTSSSAAVKVTPTTSSSAAAVKSTSSVAAAKTTSSAAAVPSTSSAAVVTPTSSAAAVTPTSSAAAVTPTSATVDCSGMFSSLVCRTRSQDPSQVSASGVSSSRSWLCGSYPQFCTSINSGGQYSTCNSVQQLSYAMNLYYAQFSSQGSSACDFGGIATLASSAAATSAPAPVVSPTPSPYPQFPTQVADLRIINNCKTQLFFEARYGNQGGALPGQNATATRALPGSYIDYTIPDTGLSGTRFWAKYGCDDNGRNCAIGDQMQYWPNPPGGCPSGGCTPPVDSLFEATWGCRPGSSCNSQNPTTWFDTSQVDGWTIPYKLSPVGDTSGCDCNGPNCGFKGVDASTLDVAKCPSGEDLTASGNYSTVQTNGQTVSLKSVDLRIIKNGQILGCMSPCKRLNWGYPYGLQQDESSGSALWMCCPTPTPNDCRPENGCIAPLTCRGGPIENTQYVSAVHTMAPGVYSYSYDDGVGLHACPAGVTKYTMEFCPSGSSAYPGTV